MTLPTRDAVLAALRAVVDQDMPAELGADVVSSDRVRDIAIEAGPTGANVGVTLTLLCPGDPAEASLRAQAEAALRGVPGVAGQAVEFVVEMPTSHLQTANRLPGVGHVIGVGAGKGGVGKSTVAVNLAVAMANAGVRVGLVDADIQGPSVPIMMGLADARPFADDERKIAPLLNHGVRFVSMGNLIGRDDAVVWRGPMVGRAVTQLFDDVRWGELDVLLVDLPPGTGDVVLTLAQTFPLAGAIVVSTPQDVAFADVTRAVKMFEMLKVDVLGLVENMAYFQAPDTGTRYDVFGPGRMTAHCQARGLALLGSLPLDIHVSPASDAGHPLTASAKNSEFAGMLQALAAVVCKQLAVRGLVRSRAADHSAFFGAAPAMPGA